VAQTPVFARAFVSRKGRSKAYLSQIRQSFSRLSDHAEAKVSDIESRPLDAALKTLSPANRNLHLRVLRAAFHFALRKQWLTQNPVASLDFSSENRGEVQVLTTRQSARLLVACRRLDPELLPCNFFGLFAGIRPEELSRMRWDSVQLDEHHIVLPREVTKTSKRRVIDIEPNLAAWIEWYASKHGKQTGNVTPSRALRHRLNAVRARARIDPWVQDVMRHTDASNWLAKHGDINRLLLNLGHYSTKVLWDHYHAAVLRKDAERFWALKPKVAGATGSESTVIPA
jgi:integrase